MSESISDAWAHTRRSLIEALDTLPPGLLRRIAIELRHVLGQIDGELERREHSSGDQDARLYRPEGGWRS